VDERELQEIEAVQAADGGATVTVKGLHRKAMELAENADKLRDSGNVTEAQLVYAQAADREFAAAQETRVQPSRAILYRSAASLDLMAGNPNCAISVATAGLSGAPPEIVAELREVITKAEAMITGGA
jgi:hypothetical protein